jgi:hypothetical protein
MTLPKKPLDNKIKFAGHRFNLYWFPNQWLFIRLRLLLHHL